MTNQYARLAKWMMLLALSGTLVGAAGCSSTPYHRSTGTYMDDKAITAKVKTALFRDPLVSGFAVHVDTFRGDVQLSGMVDTPEQKARAAQVASTVEGVQEVINNVTVKPPPTAVGGSAPVISGSGTQ